MGRVLGCSCGLADSLDCRRVCVRQFGRKRGERWIEAFVEEVLRV
jgi:hypothetical protein